MYVTCSFIRVCDIVFKYQHWPTYAVFCNNDIFASNNHADHMKVF